MGNGGGVDWIAAIAITVLHCSIFAGGSTRTLSALKSSPPRLIKFPRTRNLLSARTAQIAGITWRVAAAGGDDDDHRRAAALIRSRLGHAQSSNEHEQLCAISSASSLRMSIGRADNFLPPTEFQARGGTTGTRGILDLDLKHLLVAAFRFRRGIRFFIGD